MRVILLKNIRKSKFPNGTQINVWRGDILIGTYGTYIEAYRAAAGGDSLYVGPGTFECTTPIVTESPYVAGTLSYAKGLVTGVPGKSILRVRSDVTNASMRDNVLFSGGGTFRNLIIDYVMASGKTNNYQNSMFRWCTGVTVRHCVIRTYSGNLLILSYYNSSPAYYNYMQYCTVISHRNFASSYSGADRIWVQNCAFSLNQPADGNRTNNAVNQTLDAATFKLSQNNDLYGVYAGGSEWL